MEDKKSASKSLHVHLRDLRPLKLGVRFSPPSISLMYSIGDRKSKKYVHEVAVSSSAHVGSTPLEIYKRLLSAEPSYLNPKLVPQKQVLRLISMILMRVGSAPTSAMTTEEEKTAQLAMPREAFSGRGPIKAQRDLGHHPSAQEPRLEGDDEGEELDYKEMEKALEKEGSNFLHGFRQVYVEDLKRELLMDPQGNLFDFDGNLIGQAEGGESGDDSGQGFNDEQYFEDDGESGPPVGMPEQKRLPPVMGKRGLL